MRYVFLLFLALPLPSYATVFLEDMTWPEVAAALQNGKTSIIIPTGGTEQNGPHMVHGKHNYIVKYTAQKIAQQRDNMLVAPVLAYVPEGRIDPPEAHMNFAGTISISEKTFQNVLIDTAKSLRQHGFTHIYFLGDSGQSQNSQQKAAKKLKKWRKNNVFVVSLNEYYAGNGQQDYLLQEGFAKEDIGWHAGMRDTSELLVVNPNGVRPHYKTANSQNFDKTGLNGNASLASTETGQKMLELKVKAGLRQILEIEKKALNE